LVNFGQTSLTQESQTLANCSQLRWNLGPGSRLIKIRDKEEFERLTSSPDASNSNFHMLKLLLECYWLEYLNPIAAFF